MKERRTTSELRCRDRAGSDEYIRENMGLVFNVIQIVKKKFPGSCSLFERFHEDLVGVGMYALMSSHRDHKPEIAKISTLSHRYIFNAIINKLRSLSCKKNRLTTDFEFGIYSQTREMRPDVAAITNETILRNSTQSLFEEQPCED